MRNRVKSAREFCEFLGRSRLRREVLIDKIPNRARWLATSVERSPMADTSVQKSETILNRAAHSATYPASARRSAPRSPLTARTSFPTITAFGMCCLNSSRRRSSPSGTTRGGMSGTASSFTQPSSRSMSSLASSRRSCSETGFGLTYGRSPAVAHDTPAAVRCSRLLDGHWHGGVAVASIAPPRHLRSRQRSPA